MAENSVENAEVQPDGSNPSDQNHDTSPILNIEPNELPHHGHNGYEFNTDDDREHYNNAQAGAGHESGTIFAATEQRHHEQDEREKRERARNALAADTINSLLNAIALDFGEMKEELDGLDTEFDELAAETEALIADMSAQRIAMEEELERQNLELQQLEEELANGTYAGGDENYHRAQIELKKAEIANTTAVITHYDQQIETTSGKLEDAAQNIREARQEMQGLQHKIEVARNSGASEEEISRLKSEMAEVRQEIEEARQSVDQLNAKTTLVRNVQETLIKHEKAQSCAFGVEGVNAQKEFIEARTNLTNAVIAATKDDVIVQSELENIAGLAKEVGIGDNEIGQFAQDIQAAGIDLEIAGKDGKTVRLTGNEVASYITSRWAELKEEEARLAQHLEATNQNITVTDEKLLEIDQRIAAKDSEIQAKEQEIDQQELQLKQLSDQLGTVEADIAREQNELGQLETNMDTVEKAMNDHGSIFGYMFNKHDLGDLAFSGGSLEVEESQLLMHGDKHVFMDTETQQLYTVEGTGDEQTRTFIEDPVIDMKLRAQIFSDENTKYPSNFVSNSPVKSENDSYWKTLRSSVFGMTGDESRKIAEAALAEQKQIIASQSRPALEAKLAQAEVLKKQIDHDRGEVASQRQALQQDRTQLVEERADLVAERKQTETDLVENREEQAIVKADAVQNNIVLNGANEQNTVAATQTQPDEATSNTDTTVSETSASEADTSGSVASESGTQETLEVTPPKHNLDEIAAARNEMNNLLDQVATRQNLTLSEDEVKQILDSGMITYEELTLAAANAGVFKPEEMDRYANGTDLQEDQPEPKEQQDLIAQFANNAMPPAVIEEVAPGMQPSNGMQMRA
ncbi:MAG: hypothetical protein ACRBDL_01100 [Alphaproteobacteria bacterium]